MLLRNCLFGMPFIVLLLLLLMVPLFFNNGTFGGPASSKCFDLKAMLRSAKKKAVINNNSSSPSSTSTPKKKDKKGAKAAPAAEPAMSSKSSSLRDHIDLSISDTLDFIKDTNQPGYKSPMRSSSLKDEDVPDDYFQWKSVSNAATVMVPDKNGQHEPIGILINPINAGTKD